MKRNASFVPVAIGGLSGIVLGATTDYALLLNSDVKPRHSYDWDDFDDDDAVVQVNPVSDDQPFGEAFAAARAEYGPGAWFQWRGNIYATYNAEEWSALPEGEREAFAQKAFEEAADMGTHRLAGTESHVAEDAQSNHAKVAYEDVHVSESVEDVHTGEEVQITKIDEDVQVAEPVEIIQKTEIVNTTTWNDLADEENDVRVIGYQDIELDDGHVAFMQEIEINGQRVAIIDVDDDGEADVAMSDLNHNSQMDEGEVIDLHTGEVISFTNDDTTFEVPVDDTDLGLMTI